MYHIFTHSSVDGHLGGFHVLAIVNSAAVNIGVHVLFQIMFFFTEYMPRSGIAGSDVSSVSCILFSIVAAPICIPSNSVGVFPSLHISSSIYCWLTFFIDGCSYECEVMPHCSFDLHFSNK